MDISPDATPLSGSFEMVRIGDIVEYLECNMNDGLTDDCIFFFAGVSDHVSYFLLRERYLRALRYYCIINLQGDRSG